MRRRRKVPSFPPSPRDPAAAPPEAPSGRRKRRRRRRRGAKAGSGSAAQKNSHSYSLAFEDAELLRRDALRPVRLQLEMWKTDLILREHGIRSTVAIFGSTRITDRKTAQARISRAEAELARDPGNPALVKEVEVARSLLAKSRYYDEARRFAATVSAYSLSVSCREFVIVTGGGPGIMEAANRGAQDVGAKSIGLNIRLPFEQEPNPYVTPQLCFQFRYFAIRKMHFLMRAKALVAFPGGYGTLDEFFDIITLIQTGKVKAIPVILFGSEFWSRTVNFEFLQAEGTISPEDLRLFRISDSAEDAWRIIRDFYSLREPAR